MFSVSARRRVGAIALLAQLGGVLRADVPKRTGQILLAVAGVALVAVFVVGLLWGLSGRQALAELGPPAIHTQKVGRWYNLPHDWPVRGVTKMAVLSVQVTSSDSKGFVVAATVSFCAGASNVDHAVLPLAAVSGGAVTASASRLRAGPRNQWRFPPNNARTFTIQSLATKPLGGSESKCRSPTTSTTGGIRQDGRSSCSPAAGFSQWLSARPQCRLAAVDKRPAPGRMG